MRMTPEQQRVRAHLREGANRGGLEPDYVEAIGYVETEWRLGLTNMTGRDGARGGAWGPTQITEKTVRTLGYTGPMQAFNEDPYLAATWTAIILNDHRKRKPLVTLADYVAAWNAGKDDADKNNDGKLEELPPEHPTRKHYLPRAEKGLAIIRTEREENAWLS